MTEEVAKDDPILKQITDIDAGVEKLVARNQELGAQIEALRDERRAINVLVAKLQGQRALLCTSVDNDTLRNAVIEGGLAVVSTADLAAAIGNALKVRAEREG